MKIKKIKKPWGHELLFAHTKDYVGKILVIEKNEELSLQYHEQKEESIYVAQGKLEVEIGDESLVLDQGQNLHISPGTRHRFKTLYPFYIF